MDVNAVGQSFEQRFLLREAAPCGAPWESLKVRKRAENSWNKLVSVFSLKHTVSLSTGSVT